MNIVNAGVMDEKGDGWVENKHKNFLVKKKALFYSVIVLCMISHAGLLPYHCHKSFKIQLNY